MGENASVDDIKKEISCYPGPPLSAQMISLMEGMIPCDIFEDYINKTINEGKDLAQILRLNTTQIVWNNSISENVLKMKTRLQTIRDGFPQLTDERTTGSLQDLNYQFALLSSEIPAEQYEAVQDKLEQARLNMSEKLSAGGINATLLAALTKPKTFNSLHSPDGFGNFTAFNRSVSKFPWFPRNHTWVNPGSEGTTVLPASPLNDLTDISKRFRNFSMPARLDPYYDRMVELAEQNKTSDLKALVQDVLQIQPQDDPLQTLINLFKSRAPTHDAPSLPKNLTNTSDKKTMSEMLSSKVSEVMSSDQMKTIKSKLETAWNSI